jgi:TatD DNase family protein
VLNSDFKKILQRPESSARFPSFGWIDTHCHLSDERISKNLETEINEANQSGITGFISLALCREEFECIKHTKFQKFNKFIRWCAGIHPNYEKSSETDFDLIENLCIEKKLIGIGEIGLDGRVTNSEWQQKILLKQLELATNYDLPVIFHTVKKYYDLYKILKNNFPKIRGILHGFNSSLEISEIFSRFDLGFSFKASIPKTEVLQYILKRGYYFFETDAPYAIPPDSTEEFNHLRNLMWVINSIAEKTNTDVSILKERQYRNIRNLFG